MVGLGSSKGRMADQGNGTHPEDPREVPGIQDELSTRDNGFLSNCEYFKDFMNVIKSKQGTDMSAEVKTCVDGVKEQMKSFLNEEKMDNKPKTSNRLEGLRPAEDLETLQPAGKLEVRRSSGKFEGCGPARQVKKGKVYGRGLERGRKEAVSTSGSSSPESANSSGLESDLCGDIGKVKIKGKSSSHNEGRDRGRQSTKQEGEIPKRRLIKMTDGDRRRSRPTSCSSSSSDESQYRPKIRMSRAREIRGDHRQKHEQERYREESRRGRARESYLDYRQTPKLEKFRDENGQDLKRYFKRFESYCRQNIRGGEDFWLSVLEEHLEGKMLETFRLLCDHYDDYYEAKNKLTKWFEDNEELRKRKYRKKFINTKPKHNESLYMFSIRLGSIFKTAYPNHDINRSKTLMRQFKAAIPRNARESLSTQVMSHKLKNKNPDWNFIQQCVKLRDLEEVDNKDSECDEDRREVKQIEINLSRPRERHFEREHGRGGGYVNEHFEPYRRRGSYANGSQGYDRKGEYLNEGRVYNKGDGNRNENRGMDMNCSTCRRSGHSSANCRWNLGVCIYCGDPKHFVRDCPEKRRSLESRQQGNFGNRGYGNYDSDKTNRQYYQQNQNGNQRAQQQRRSESMGPQERNSYNRPRRFSSNDDHRQNNDNRGEGQRWANGGEVSQGWSNRNRGPQANHSRPSNLNSGAKEFSPRAEQNQDNRNLN